MGRSHHTRYHRELEPDFVTPLDREDIFVDWLENGGDYLNRTAVAKLFEPGSDLFEQVEEIYETMERCDDVANVPEGIALRNR